MDKITIQGLQIHSLIGVFDWEREARQPLLLDLTLELDLSKAAESDEVSDTVDYAQVAKELETIALESEFQLLEALANAMLAHLFSRYPLSCASVALFKPDILPNARQVGVELTRRA